MSGIVKAVGRSPKPPVTQRLEKLRAHVRAVLRKLTAERSDTDSGRRRGLDQRSMECALHGLAL